MQTLSKALFALSLCALPFQQISCAVPLCDEMPNDPRCSAVVTGAITLTTSRLSKNGGTLSVALKGLASGSRVTATLGPGGPMVTFSVNGDNTSGLASVASAMLGNIQTGPLTVTVSATPDNKSITKVIHVYAPPTYSDGMKISQTTGARQPTWIQVSQGDVFAGLDSATDRRIFEYHVTGTTVTTPSVPDALANTIPLGLAIDITNTLSVRPNPLSGMNYSLDESIFSDSTVTYTPLKMPLTYSKVWAVAADRMSSLVAIAGEGTDGPLKLFTLPPKGQQSVQVVLMNAPSGKQPTNLGWGFIDTDTQVDLVAVHSDGTVAVYLQKAAQGLVYDSTLSTALQTSLALPPGMPLGLAVADIDLDGLDDIVLAQNTQVAAIANEGDGTFTRTNLVNVAADAVAIGDVTGDGKPDLVLAQKSAANLVVYPNQAP